MREWYELPVSFRENIIKDCDETDVYGVFEPVAACTGITSKIADKDIALLFLHLHSPGVLPNYLLYDNPGQLPETIAHLVLSGIIEVEYNGRFVSGSNSIDVVFNDGFGQLNINASKLGMLSMQAIEYAMMFDNIDSSALAAKLYTYNTIPLNIRLRNSLSSIKATEDFLFNGSSFKMNEILKDEWTYSKNAAHGWLAWNRRNLKRDQAFNFKLYISPKPEYVACVFQKSFPFLMQSNATGFKTGSLSAGLSRPDKMVVYFSDENSLKETAEVLQKELAAYPVQGVPFSKQLDDAGMLSCGVDPVNGSWRMLITKLLATAIVQAKYEGLDRPGTMKFITARLALEGIDITNWQPNNAFFHQ